MGRYAYCSWSRVSGNLVVVKWGAPLLPLLRGPRFEAAHGMNGAASGSSNKGQGSLISGLISAEIPRI